MPASGRFVEVCETQCEAINYVKLRGKAFVLAGFCQLDTNLYLGRGTLHYIIIIIILIIWVVLLIGTLYIIC